MMFYLNIQDNRPNDDV